VEVLDCEHKTPLAQNEGHPYVAIPDIVGGRVNLGQVRRISTDDFAAWTRRTKPRPGDVVVTRRGRVGDTAPIPPGVDCAIGQNLVLLRSSGRLLDQNYLRWATTGPQWSREVDRMRNVGAVFDSLNVADIPSLRIPVPSLPAQRRIAATLSALDDKIESNRRTLRIAVQLAQSRLLTGSDRIRLGEVATLDKGVSYKGAGLEDQQSETAQPLINLGNFPVGSGWMNRSKIKYYGGEFRDRHVVTGDDVVVANTDLTQQRAVLGRAVLVPLDLGPSLFSHHVFAVRFHARAELRLALWAQLATRAARDRLTGYATGTTVAALPREALLDFSISTPASSQAVTQADALVTLAWARERESLRVTLLRDTLLPELLSGRIRVPEAGEAVESALA
jgi:type I restriction enzyme S subunit